MLGSLEDVLGISTSAFPKDSTSTMDRYKNNVIYFDHGIRTFCAGYDPGGIIIELKKKDGISRIHRPYHLYKLQSKWIQPTIRYKQRYRNKPAGRKKEKRLNVNFEVWLINATKRETKWACETYNTTLLPKYQKMVSKSQSENQPKDY